MKYVMSCHLRENYGMGLVENLTVFFSQHIHSLSVEFEVVDYVYALT
jgi:hypothetical protein